MRVVGPSPRRAGEQGGGRAGARPGEDGLLASTHAKARPCLAHTVCTDAKQALWTSSHGTGGARRGAGRGVRGRHWKIGRGAGGRAAVEGRPGRPKRTTFSPLNACASPAHPIPAPLLPPATRPHPCAPTAKTSHSGPASAPPAQPHSSEWPAPPFFPKSRNAAVSGSCPRSLAMPRRRARLRKMRNWTRVARRQSRGGRPACAHVKKRSEGEG